MNLKPDGVIDTDAGVTQMLNSKILKNTLVLGILATAGWAVGQGACEETPSEILRTSGSGPCSLCGGWLLPGNVEPSRDAAFTIHSDLPERFLTEGVLYATTPVLPPFDLNNGQPLSEEMRTQVNRGYEGITDDFEVFIFHISAPGDGSAPRRMTVYAKNNGEEAVTINPRQVLITDGLVGNVHEMESNLGRRVLDEEWDTPISTVTIQPGEGAVVAYSKVFPSFAGGNDASANVNCFGIVRAEVIGENPNLDVYTVGIVGQPNNTSNITPFTEALLDQGAQSGETSLNLATTPGGCDLRRVVGVFPSFAWRSEQMTLDAKALQSEFGATGRVLFSMALPEIQTGPCPEARQTREMLLHPPYVRNDTIGNYMTEYILHFRLINRDEEPKKIDLRFGKGDADVGLAWQLVTSNNPITDDELRATPATTKWAGPNQSSIFTSFFGEQAGVALRPCQGKYVAIRFMILGNASLPFTLETQVTTPDPDELADLDTGNLIMIQ
ncbi:MAG: hypothetical protein JJT94_17730 [Bernardetiaceae bacterium]|nr:hypothetical protein [Bernardetiaceae bacterium]